MRAFVGIAMSDAFRMALVDAGCAIREHESSWRDARWVPERNLHITLRFLGDISAESAKRLGEGLVLALSTEHPTNVAFAGVRARPRSSRARMLWAEFTDDSGALASITGTITACADSLGIPVEDRRFTAHCTLVRARQPMRVSPEAMTAADDAMRSALGRGTVMSVGEATLYESTLTKTGAIYDEVRTVPIGSPR